MLLFALMAWLSAIAFQAAQSAASPQTSEAAARAPHTQTQYVGVEACRPCHARHVQNVLKTSHWLTSRPATRETIVVGSIPADSIDITTSNPELRYRVNATVDGVFQTAVIGKPNDARLRTQRIDLVIGSGRKGQTYLWWRGDELFQLPLSYWNELKSWANSPGQSDRTADFTRPVPPRCLDCHATFVQVIAPNGNRFARGTIVLGITCEKCHGPAGAHIEARRAERRSQAAPGSDVVNPAHLSRDRRVDLCASCHGGQILGPPFSFVPGDPVRRAPVIANPPRSAGNTTRMVSLGIDSHGQQATALMNSRCYQASAMTCETCHDPHVSQGDPGAFSSRCLTCHKVETCGRFARDGRAIAGKCVDCHMPSQPSSLILSANAAGPAQAHLRTHLIAVHPETPSPRPIP